MSGHVSNAVQQLNDLNRVKPRLDRQKRETPDFDRWSELLAICVAVSMQQDNLRWMVAQECAPWFDASAFENCCPKCGGETYTAKYGPECSAGCDTSVLTCRECGWQGTPE